MYFQTCAQKLEEIGVEDEFLYLKYTNLSNQNKMLHVDFDSYIPTDFRNTWHGTDEKKTIWHLKKK